MRIFKPRYFLLPGILLLMHSCAYDQGNVNNRGKKFDIPSYFKSEIEQLTNLNAGIAKAMTKDGNTESYQSDTTDWLKELQPFLESDLNKTALVNSYRADSIITGQNLTLIYTAVDSIPPIKKVEIYFQEGKPDSIYIINELSNPYYVSKETLMYRSLGNYTITGFNQPRLGKSIYFHLHGEAILPKNK